MELIHWGVYVPFACLLAIKSFSAHSALSAFSFTLTFAVRGSWPHAILKSSFMTHNYSEYFIPLVIVIGLGVSNEAS